MPDIKKDDGKSNGLFMLLFAAVGVGMVFAGLKFPDKIEGISPTLMVILGVLFAAGGFWMALGPYLSKSKSTDGSDNIQNTMTNINTSANESVKTKTGVNNFDISMMGDFASIIQLDSNIDSGKYFQYVCQTRDKGSISDMKIIQLEGSNEYFVAISGTVAAMRMYESANNSRYQAGDRFGTRVVEYATNIASPGCSVDIAPFKSFMSQLASGHYRVIQKS